MTTTTDVTVAERIVAIDLGKYKSVLSDYHASTGEVACRTPLHQFCEWQLG